MSGFMSPTLLLIPTFNERTNVPVLVDQIRGLDLEVDMLFIDDASPDGTGEVLNELAEEHSGIEVLHRSEKLGLGSAYREGFAVSLEREYQNTVCMDADFSHNPDDLPRLLEGLYEKDLVIGSRYLPEGGIRNWPWSRRLLSKSAAVYTRLVTRLPLTDPTGGFNAYRNEMLENLPLSDMTSNGYSFQIEMKHLAWSHGFRIQEIPIVFVERREGKSKMSPGIIREALWLVWRILLKK